MSDFSDISKILTGYADGVKEQIEEETREVVKEGASRLKNTRNTYKVRSGDYNKSWSYKVNKTYDEVNGTVYARKPHYRLTHLLEYGHATRNGGRTRAFVHIAPVNDYCCEIYEERVKNAIKRGGK